MEFKSSNQFEGQKFTSPEEEIAFLRRQILEKEKVKEKVSDIERESVINQTIHEYKKHEPEKILEKGTLVSEHIRDEIVLELSPEEHDDKMAEIMHLLETKGIANTLSIVQKMEKVSSSSFKKNM